LVQLVSQSVSLLGGVVLFVINARLTLVMLAVLPAVIVAAAVFGRRLRRISTAFQDELAAANARAEEAIVGVRVVQSFTAERHEARRYGDAIAATFRSALRRARVRALFVPSIITGFFLGIGLVLWYGGRLALAGELPPGDLITFLLLTVTVAGSIGAFTGLYSQVQEAIGASRRVFELLDTAPDLPEAAAPPRALVDVRGEVRFEGVRFRYGDRGDGWVLDGIDLVARPGEVVALVGPSGAGKSTLVTLIPRFFDPSRGASPSTASTCATSTRGPCRAHVGVVPQETLLFSGRSPTTSATDVPRRATPRSRPPPSRPTRTASSAPSPTATHPRGRARGEALRRTAAAHRDRARSAQGPPHPGARRGHVVARQRVGGPGAVGAGAPHARPHHLRDRPPAVDRPRGRPDRGGRPRPHRPERAPRRTDGGRRALRRPVRDPVPRAPPEAVPTLG
jgi:hypothetical protein